jgi:hypothetical protein
MGLSKGIFALCVVLVVNGVIRLVSLGVRDGRFTKTSSFRHTRTHCGEGRRVSYP